MRIGFLVVYVFLYFATIVDIAGAWATWISNSNPLGFAATVSDIDLIRF